MKIKTIILTALLLMTGDIMADTIKGKEISMTFAADGRPLLVARSDGKNLINAKDPGDGFYLLTGTGSKAKKQRFTYVDYKGGKLIASATPGKMPRVTFAVSVGEKHIAFKIERIEGIPTRNNSVLYFEANFTRGVSTIALDYMTPGLWHSGALKQQAGGKMKVTWPYLWHKSEDDPLGGFAFHCPINDEDHDDAVLRIWVKEELPHPKIEGAWTLARAKQWIKEWQKTFERFDQLLITAKKPEDLDILLDYAKKLGADRIYMHTDTWRYEYWPRKNETLYVNPAVFPGGEKDFKKFTDKLTANGIGTVIHTVCYGFGEEGSKYVGEKPDKRLAFWGKGKLEKPASADDKTIYFRPDPGTEYPLLTSYPTAPVPKSYNHIWSFNQVRIDDEIVQVGEFQDTDKPVWKLTRCSRGKYATKAAAHKKSAEFVGLLKAYGQNFVPSSLTDLSEKTAKEYADFFNRNGVFHHEFDGAEIHSDVPWGFNKWSKVVYENTDHPVSCNTSGGRPTMWNMEFRMKSLGVLDLYHSRGIANIFLHEERRLSTGPLENNFYLGHGAAKGFKKFDMEKPEPMFGVTVEMLEKHGLSGMFTEQFINWKDLSLKLSSQQRKEILAPYFYHGKGETFGMGGNHPSAKMLHEVRKTDAGYEVRPFVVMARGKEDIAWLWGQEFGVILPRQYVLPGDKLRLNNPFKKQEPEFIIHVMNGFSDKASGKASSQAKINKELEAYESSAGASGKVSAKAAEKGGLASNRIQPKASEIIDAGDQQFTDEGKALKIKLENKRSHRFVQDKALPYFKANANNSNARGVGMTVTGDGSGAVLTIQTFYRGGMKDYVVPIDFKGRKDIVIPCGEAAWSEGRWGFRFKSKGSRYGKVDRVAIGFGKVPANVTAEVQVANLRILSEVPAVLKDPVIHAGQGTLVVKGEIKSDQYLWYRGGDDVGVYDLNWNLVVRLPVAKQAYAVKKGYAEFSVSHAGKSVQPWLDIQFIARGDAFMVKP